jgi:hypothetical protein
MGTKTKIKKSAKPKKVVDKFFERDHSKDPYIMRKLEKAKEMIGDGSCLKEFLDKLEKDK